MNLTITPGFPPKLAVSDNLTPEDLAVVIIAARTDKSIEDALVDLFFDPDQLTSTSAKYAALAKLAAVIEGPAGPKA
jgi:hypothetical protein